MKLLERIAFTMGLVVVGVTVVYRYVLTAEQRSALGEAGDAIRSATREVTDTVAPLVSDGPTKSEEEAMAAANRARTIDQWQKIGY
ncbi:MAG: hypothetical protein Q4B54_12705 [Coriobacteriales bacterium]|nr:hypothetical protein [Coriobacteriales bacterium]